MSGRHRKRVCGRADRAPSVRALPVVNYLLIAASCRRETQRDYTHPERETEHDNAEDKEANSGSVPERLMLKEHKCGGPCDTEACGPPVALPHFTAAAAPVSPEPIGRPRSCLCTGRNGIIAATHPTPVNTPVTTVGPGSITGRAKATAAAPAVIPTSAATRYLVIPLTHERWAVGSKSSRSNQRECFRLTATQDYSTQTVIPVDTKTSPGRLGLQGIMLLLMWEGNDRGRPIVASPEPKTSTNRGHTPLSDPEAKTTAVLQRCFVTGL